MGIFWELIYLFILFWFSWNCIHEYGHALTARLLGIKINEIQINFVSRSYVNAKIINDADVRTILFRISGGFFAGLFILVALLIFPLKLKQAGIFLSIANFSSGIIEGFANELYTEKKVASIAIIFILSIIIFLCYPFF